MSRDGLFEKFGIELEYMLVRDDSLDVAPIADRILEQVAGCITNEVERGIMAWSNELALHVIEIKNSTPVSDLPMLVEKLQHEVEELGRVAASQGAILLPTAMHPWMNPHTETRLWPHGNRDIYHTYNRIFNCQGHGWSNVQSTHLNLGFATDAGFGRLHAAIRVLLPLLPAIAASSPAADGALTGWLDTRLDYYRNNQKLIPSITGQVIPEPVFSEAKYEREIYQRLRRDIAAHDPDGVLEAEWLNSRGAIARFDRNAIEIRVLDIQECPLADVSLAVLICAVLKGVCAERWSGLAALKAAETGGLAEIFSDTVQNGEQAVIDNQRYLALFGRGGKAAMTAGELWQTLAADCASELAEAGSGIQQSVETMLARGPLSRQIIRALGDTPDRERFREVYWELGKCLAQGRLFFS
ncbi:MAG: glutamate--cysteine ligase [Proteobacteria bacterium]|jgi:gamma-glutamyl:cysteine ligase YbdK (ATP-grasp superfamily)|nr:glutamate--cysteine ligase [Pseudomonadota bacterium]MCG2824742.1 glutamate-cysteine ligase family protein [Desulfobulbaceae bacterium]MDP2001338.1 glutamate-cysteine ligase family protein [Desulfurivibrionaceae bacterium]